MNLKICAVFVVGLVFCSAENGIRNSESRIVGGFPASMNTTKHQVSIRILAADQTNFGQGHICGGSLINNMTVLTAAHCLYDSKDKLRKANVFRIVGGNLYRNIQDANTFVSTVSAVRPHRSYNPKDFDNDIALMILTTAVPVTHPTFVPIPLLSTAKPANTSCEISGWGTTSYEGPSSLTLLAANVSIISTAICNGPNSYDGLIKKGMLCAGRMEGGVDGCQGDSGGPLVCNGQLTGVTSHGYYCAVRNYPGVYADIMVYKDWIKANSSNRLVASNLLLIIFVCIRILFKS